MDRQKLRELSEAATPGNWEWYTSCSYTRLGTSDGYKVLMFATKYKDGVCGIEFTHKPDADFIAAANPAAILGLLDAIESLQRERDALQARIDTLMLEYCPDEMTPEQIKTWENNQIISLQEVQPNEQHTKTDR